MPNLNKMNVRVSAAEWNALCARLAALTVRLNKFVEAEKKELAKTKVAEKKVLDKAEKAEQTRLARNLKERCRHLLVGKTNSARRAWYDSASQSERNARIEEILIEVGIKEAPKKCATTGCPNKEYEDGWCEECCAEADREGGYDDESEEEDCECGACSRCVADDTCAAQCGDKGTITVVSKNGTTSLVCKDCCAWFKKQNE